MNPSNGMVSPSMPTTHYLTMDSCVSVRRAFRRRLDLRFGSFDIAAAVQVLTLFQRSSAVRFSGDSARRTVWSFVNRWR